MATAPRERVALRDPKDKFTVLVSPSRAERLIARGYRVPKGATTAPAASAPEVGRVPDRATLTLRAKAVGVPVKGTNVALLAAITQAEAEAAAGGEG